MKRLQTYHGGDITVTFDPSLCIHSAVCLARLPAVFDVSRKRWIDPKAATSEEVMAAIRECPSGALKFALDSPSAADGSGAAPPAPSGRHGARR